MREFQAHHNVCCVVETAETLLKGTAVRMEMNVQKNKGSIFQTMA